MDPQVAHEISQREMTHHPMRADGNCFFHAMAFALVNQLHIPNFTARILRQRGVDYFLADDNLHVRFNNGQDQAAIDAYAAHMRQRGIFAEGEIIEAMAILLDVRIAILNNNNGVFNFFTLNQNAAPARTVYLLRTDIQGRPPHYDALLHQVLPLVATPAANNMLINSTAGKKVIVATQDFEKILPPALDALTDLNIDALYSERIRPYLLQLLKAQGSIDDEIEKISQEIPSQKVMLDSISNLKQALNIAEAQLHEHMTELEISYKTVEKKLKVFMNEMSLWTEDHEYLTEGWGRFEEYDSADSDYDSGAAAAFSVKLRNKYVIDALDDDWHMCSLDEFIEHLQTLQSSVHQVMGAQDLIFENSAKIYDIYEALQEASKEVAALVESLDGAMPQDEYGYPANPFEQAAIQQGIDLFQTLQGMLSEFEEAWKTLSLKLEKYAAQQEEIEDTEADLDSALVKLGDEIENTTQNKKADSALPLKNLLGKYNKEITDQQKTSLKHLITLLLRDKLDRPETQSVLSQLQGMFGAKEKKTG